MAENENNNNIDIKELLAELQAVKMQNSELEAEIQKAGEATELLPSLQEKLEQYQGFVVDTYKKTYENAPETIKKYIDYSQFESDPLQGIQAINQINGFAQNLLEDLKKQDPTQSGASKKDSNNNKVDPNNFSSIINFLTKKGD